jgi:hypothetical protein
LSRAILVVDGQLTCRTCNERKPVASFYRDKASACGYDRRCKACSAERARDYISDPAVKARVAARTSVRRKHPDERRRLTAQHQAWTQLRPEWRIWYSAKLRAKAKGWPFSISVADVVIPERCPLLDVPLAHNRGTKGPCAASPTLDRIDSTRGYELGNVWVISYRANAIKNDGTPDELERIAAGVRARLNQ